MKKIISLFLLFILSFSATESVYAYNEAENIQIISLSVTDDGGRAVSEISDLNSNISISVILKNYYLNTASVTLFATICNSETGRVKAVAKSKGITIPKYSKARLDANLNVSEYSDIVPGDKINLFFWDSIQGMQQARGYATGDELLKYKLYQTNNIAEYNYEKNGPASDSWSYAYTMDMASVGMCAQLGENWHLAVGKEDNWYIGSDGTTVTEGGRIMIFNYTIGEFTAEKKLKISGTFSGETSSTLTVIKSDDTSVSSIGKINTEEMLLEQYNRLAAGDGKFEITIPAEQAKQGNDILFCIEPQEEGYYENTLDVTITAEETPGYKSNNVKDFSTDNSIAGGKWSYVGSDIGKNPFTKNADNSEIGTFSYDKLLEPGTGEIYAANEYAYDLTDEDKFSFLTSDGKVYTDRALTYVYTLNGKFTSADEIQISGNTSGTTNAYYLTVLKTSDLLTNEIGSDVEVIYNKGGRNAKEFSVTLEPAKCAEGNDIIFIIRPLGDMSFEAIETNFNVSAAYKED